MHSLPLDWIPQTVIVDAMFLINTKPLRRTKNITAYSHLLFNRFVLDHYMAGVEEVHLLFDMPCKRPFNPKQFEQGRRDVKSRSKSTHHHLQFTPDTPIPPNWCQYIECRQCKCSIVEAIGLAYLQTGKILLHQEHRLVIAGCFSGDGEENAWIIHPGAATIAEPTMRTNPMQQKQMHVFGGM